MTRPAPRYYPLCERRSTGSIPISPPPLVDGAIRTTTWTYKHGNVSIMERGERIRPERQHHRRPVQRLQWRHSRWVAGFSDVDFDSRISSMTIADVSPKVAVKRIVMLYENFQYREAANFVNRLNHGTFKAILGDLPIDLFVESMPQSLPILEALYAKVFLSDGLSFSVKMLRPDSVVAQMVRFFARQGESNSGEISKELLLPFVGSCKKLLKVITLSDPKIRKALQGRKKAVDKVLEGLGQHGMVGTSDESLMNLHDALKLEFETVVHSYKVALNKLEELSLAQKTAVLRSVSHGPAPTEASHQRQLTLKQEEIQERLIKNKTLLNVIEPTLTNHSLDILLGILQRRIEFDKDALFQFTQIRKEVKDIQPNTVVAPILMRFSNGCSQVLDLMKEVAEDEDEDSSDISGYHSDSDSAIMMSGNSPYISKRARYNFISRSIRLNNKSGPTRPPLSIPPSAGSGSDSPSSPSSETASTRHRALHRVQRTDIYAKLKKPTPVGSSDDSGHEGGAERKETERQAQMKRLRDELEMTRHTMRALQEEKVMLKQRLEEQAKTMAARCVTVKFEASGSREQLVSAYSNLYEQARLDTLDALDAMTKLHMKDDLKSKLLFSVVVIPPLPAGGTEKATTVEEAAAVDLERAVSEYMQKTAETHDLTKPVDEVCTQIWATLYDYPALKQCEGLIQYIKNCVRLAWGLSNQVPPYVIDYEQRVFRRDIHRRFHSSNHESETVQTYLWPALFEGEQGPCVHKAVVLT